MKNFLFFVTAAVFFFLAGCAAGPSLAPLSIASSGFEEVSMKKAAFGGTVLFENRTPAARSECAIFHGQWSEWTLFVEGECGRPELATPPQFVFEVRAPKFRDGRFWPSATVIDGFRRGQNYTVLCVYRRTLGGYLGYSVTSFRLYDGMMRDTYVAPSAWNRQGIIVYRVNRKVALQSPRDGVIRFNLRYTIPPY